MIATLISTIAEHTINEKIVDSYLNSQLNSTRTIEKTVTHDKNSQLEAIKAMDTQHLELNKIVSKLVKTTKNIMYNIATIDIEKIKEEQIKEELTQLYKKTSEVVIVSEQRMNESKKKIFRDEHEKVLFHTIALNNFLYVLIDDVLLDTIDDIIVSENIFETGREIYTLRKELEQRAV